MKTHCDECGAFVEEVWTPKGEAPKEICAQCYINQLIHQLKLFKLHEHIVMRLEYRPDLRCWVMTDSTAMFFGIDVIKEQVKIRKKNELLRRKKQLKDRLKSPYDESGEPYPEDDEA